MFGPGFDDEPRDPRIGRLEDENRELRNRVERLTGFLQELTDDTDPTGPMADAAVHAAIREFQRAV